MCKAYGMYILRDEGKQDSMGFFERLFSKRTDDSIANLTQQQHREQFPQKYKTVHMVVDEQLINAKDVQGVIEPLWWSVSIYDGEGQYEEDLQPFTRPQRYVFAIQWYVAEVNNGGHCQFYDNSTGIVWEDAMRGFEAIGAQKNADIIKESAGRMGGNPSKDREKRQEQLENIDPSLADLDDLDRMYYESEADMMELLYTYIRENAKDFIFSGKVTVPISR